MHEPKSEISTLPEALWKKRGKTLHKKPKEPRKPGPKRQNPRAAWKNSAQPGENTPKKTPPSDIASCQSALKPCRDDPAPCGKKPAARAAQALAQKQTAL